MLFYAPLSGGMPPGQPRGGQMGPIVAEKRGMTSIGTWLDGRKTRVGLEVTRPGRDPLPVAVGFSNWWPVVYVWFIGKNTRIDKNKVWKNILQAVN